MPGKRIIADKRRDRDLEVLGYVVMPVTKEDLQERGGLDRVVSRVIDAIEREGARNLEAQRQLLENESLAQMRQLLMWSLMPGTAARDAREQLRELVEAMRQTDDGQEPKEEVGETNARESEEPRIKHVLQRRLWTFARPLEGAHPAASAQVVIEYWEEKARDLLLGDV